MIFLPLKSRSTAEGRESLKSRSLSFTRSRTSVSVNDDDLMTQTTNSIKIYSVLVPGIVRPRERRLWSSPDTGNAAASWQNGLPCPALFAIWITIPGYHHGGFQHSTREHADKRARKGVQDGFEAIKRQAGSRPKKMRRKFRLISAVTMRLALQWG